MQLGLHRRDGFFADGFKRVTPSAKFPNPTQCHQNPGHHSGPHSMDESGTLKNWRLEALPQLSSFQIKLPGSGVNLGKRGAPNKDEADILNILEEGWRLRV